MLLTRLHTLVLRGLVCVRHSASHLRMINPVTNLQSVRKYPHPCDPVSRNPWTIRVGPCLCIPNPFSIAFHRYTIPNFYSYIAYPT